MEPYSLTLSQVNVEEQELGESSAYENLYSFSNLVSFDSDFQQEEDTHAIPVIAKKVRPDYAASRESAFSSQQPEAQAQTTNRYLHNFFKLQQESRSKPVTDHAPFTQRDLDMALYRERKSRYGSRRSDNDAASTSSSMQGNEGVYPQIYPDAVVVDANTNLSSSYYSMDDSQTQNSMNFAPDSHDSFRAFTDTVEALALQQSVIGKKGVKPASAEEIASVLAATRKRMLESGQLKDSTSGQSDNTSIASIAAQVGLKLASAAQSTNPSTADQKDSEMLNNNNLIAYQFDEEDGSMLISMTGGDEDYVVRPANSGEFPTSSTPKSSPSYTKEKDSRQKELIRIPPEEIVTIIEKNGSWFSGKKIETRTTVKISGDEVDGSQEKGQEMANGSGQSVRMTPEKMQVDRESEHTPIHRSKEEKVVKKKEEVSSKPSSHRGSDSHTAKEKKVNEVAKQSSRRKSKEKISPEEKSNSNGSKSVSPESRDVKIVTDEAKAEIAADRKSGGNVDEESVSTDVVHSHARQVNGGHESQQSSVSVARESRHVQKSSTEEKSEKGIVKHVTHTESHHHEKVNIVQREQREISTVVEVTREPPKKSPSKPVSPVKETIVRIAEPKNLSSDSLKVEIERLLREKAKLEGHIEVLEAECSAALRERAQLQSQVAAVTQQLKCQESSSRTVTAERDALSADYETLRQNRARLEQVILDSNRLMQDKDEELMSLQEDLRLAKEAEKGLQHNLKELNTQLQNREQVLADLKGKIAELYVNFQTAEQNRILAESEKVSLKSENKTLLTGKEWYMQQLSLAQEAKTSLQHDITKLKADIIAQATLVERTRAENVRLQAQLKETEQRALQEKEQLAKHLEAIEAEMLEREATFAQIKNERLSMESLLSSRLEQGKEQSTEAAEELQKAQNELRRHQANIQTLEHMQTELNRRLALSQESILERDQTVERLEQKLVELETELCKTQQEVGHKEVDISMLQEEKLTLEVELKGAKQEKNAFDRSLQSLKGDMGRVEVSFRQMKADLDGRQRDIEQLKQERDELRRALEVQPKVHVPVESVPLQSAAPSTEILGLREQISELSLQRESLEEERGKLRERIAELEGSLKELSHGKTELEQNLGMAEGRLEHMELKVRNLIEEKAHLEGQLLKAAAGQASGDKELESLQQNLLTAEMKLREERELATHTQQELTMQLHNVETRLRKELEEYEERTVELQAALEGSEVQMESERKAAEARISELSEKLDLAEKLAQDRDGESKQVAKELQEKLATTEDLLRKERISHEERLESLVAQLRKTEECNDRTKYENALQELNIRLEQSDHALQQERTAYEMRLQEMAKIIRETEARMQQDVEKHRAEIQKMEKEIQELQQNEVTLQEEVKEAEKKMEVEVVHRTEKIETQLTEMHVEISILKEEKIKYELLLKQASEDSERELEEYQQRVTALEAEVDRLKEELAEAEKSGAYNRDLTLELEKERGRLEGLQQTYSSLKVHSSRVEAALAERESSVMELSSHADSELLRQSRELTALREQLKEAESLRKEDLSVIKQLKAQMTSEKEIHAKIRRELETSQRNCAHLEEDLELARQETKTRSSELENCKKRELQYKTQLDKTLEEQKQLRQTKDALKREVEERSAKDPVQMEEMKTLEWKLSEKQNEVTALQEQVQIVTDRQDMQMASLQTHLQTSQAELQKVKAELANVKKDKNSLQAKVAELKGALRASVQHATLQEKEGSSDGSGDSKPKHLPFDLAMLEKLLQDPAPVTEQSKPLSVLQNTLTGLRSQITTLQSQFDQHASAVQTSSMAWKELEAEVQDLREVCKNSAAERAASQTLLESSMHYTTGSSHDLQEAS